MSGTCGAVHPIDSSRRCVAKGNTHGDHVDGNGPPWPNTERLELVQAAMATKKTKQRRGRLRTIVADARAGKKAILAGDSGPGLDPEIVGVWKQDEWQTYAGRIVEQFLRTRTEDFTTAEDVWPLLDKPEEMRAMSILIQALLRAGHIEEIAAKRLRGTYRTKDGFEFAENKLVPIYRSRLVRATSVPTWGDPSQNRASHDTLTEPRQGGEE